MSKLKKRDLVWYIAISFLSILRLICLKQAQHRNSPDCVDYQEHVFCRLKHKLLISACYYDSYESIARLFRHGSALVIPLVGVIHDTCYQNVLSRSAELIACICGQHDSHGFLAEVLNTWKIMYWQHILLAQQAD